MHKLQKPTEWLAETRAALASDCGYSNDLLGVTQAIMLAQTRDSEARERSNWQVISADMLAKFGDESAESWHIERFGHWACGWLEYLIVTVYTENVPDAEAQAYLNKRQLPAFTSDCFDVMLDWQNKLSRNRIANEDHLSQLEWDELHEYVESEVSYLRSRGRLTSRAPKTDALIASRVLQSDALSEAAKPDDTDDESILEALQALGYAYKHL